MRRKLCIVLLLFVLSLEAANEIVGAAIVPARQNNLLHDFFPAALRPDGVARAQTQRRRRHRQRKRLRAKSGGLSNMDNRAVRTSSQQQEVVAPRGEAPSEPMVGSSPSSAPPARKAAPIDVNKPGAPRKSAPGIKPPTVQIKPPTR